MSAQSTSSPCPPAAAAPPFPVRVSFSAAAAAAAAAVSLKRCFERRSRLTVAVRASSTKSPAKRLEEEARACQGRVRDVSVTWRQWRRGGGMEYGAGMAVSGGVTVVRQ